MRIHKVFPDEFPEPWASDWGEDDYGIFMGFTYKGVRQDFRWIEPGTFLMGSPEGELGRFDNETQNEVTLSKGFWLADTTVTQALWEAVMGVNASHFLDGNRPVENVSWDDAQTFIGRMNAMKPDLHLCLPTEAQWEYACRAGTDTPFYFGEQIQAEWVNFDATVPYLNGQRGEYRQQTVEVKRFSPNPWGLYEMHGNVWEWCQDWYGEYPVTSVIDPIGLPSGAYRVLRGGSWFDSGRLCRSAARHHRIPSNGIFDYYGFRLARGLSRDLIIKASNNVTTVIFTHIH